VVRDRVLTTLEQCRVPTIAAINGACTGGGAGIAACCDLRIGTKTAKFGFPIARTLGNCLSAANIGRLSALIGATRLKEIIFTARLIEAEEAAGIALLHEVVEDLPALERRADELALLIADQSVSNKFARAYWIIHRLRAALVARTDEVIE
jgi:enoyl-CoA hydratase/carnithine racemase